MISICLLNEDRLENWLSTSPVDFKTVKDANDARTKFAADTATGRQAWADTKGAKYGMSGPEESWWHKLWPFSSDESDAVNRINNNETMMRRLYWQPELVDTYKHGTPDSFLANPVGWSVNAVMDNPIKTGLGLAATGYAAYKAKQLYDKKKQEKQLSQGLSGFSNSSGY